MRLTHQSGIGPHIYNQPLNPKQVTTWLAIGTHDSLEGNVVSIQYSTSANRPTNA